jgi:hypothetical protein
LNIDLWYLIKSTTDDNCETTLTNKNLGYAIQIEFHRVKDTKDLIRYLEGICINKVPLFLKDYKFIKKIGEGM